MDDDSVAGGYQPLGENERMGLTDYSSDGSVTDEDVDKISVEDLLNEILLKIKEGSMDLTNQHDFEKFREHYGDHLASGTENSHRPTALHILAAMAKTDLPKLDGKMEPLIKFLVHHQNNLLKIQDISDHTPLFLAIEQKKEKMVQWICDAHSSINTILNVSNVRGMNCLHIGIEKRVKFVDLLIERAEPATFAAQDEHGNTPLHLAVEYKKCKMGQLAIVERIVAKGDDAIQSAASDLDFNKEGLSPYLYHIESVRKGREKDMEKSNNEAKEQEKGTDGIRLTSTISPITKGVMSGQKVRVMPPLNPPSSNISLRLNSGQGSRSVRRQTDNIQSPTTYGGRLGQPPTSLNRSVKSPPVSNSLQNEMSASQQAGIIAKGNSNIIGTSNSDRRSSRVDEGTVNNIERFLKLHYLRSRRCERAMEILYGRNATSDLELNFDLFRHTKITQGAFENLLSNIEFGDILQYVNIPRISFEENMNAANSKRTRTGVSRSSQLDGDGRRDAYHIFEHLRKKGVKIILKIIVDDLQMPAHSDEAIEDALKLMNVEIWDWRKRDLCSEVIVKVAPKVREAHLYWGGNNAVLRGWSDEGGLKRLKDLRKVYLHVEQGLESKIRTRRHVVEFYDRMKRLCPTVKVVEEGLLVQPKFPIINTALVNSGQTEQSTKHEWIQCMKDFSRLLFDAEMCYDGSKIAESIEEPIKIALIDDGVDVKDLKYTFIGGRTFCTRDEENNLNDPYYASSTGHGTTMAKQIHLLCPRAQFYVLRLEDHASEDSSRQITAKSAAQAIKAAIRKKVHIISMSWTIDPPANKKEMESLENAISEAANADILMFCSASDKGAHQKATYPAKATSKIFTIGAAKASGAVDDWVGDINNIDFTFPGTKVELDGEPTSSQDVKEVTGSSVATALAAGLAALILYCAQIRLFLITEKEKQRAQGDSQAFELEKKKARQDFQALKKHENMQRVFRDIGTTEASKHKFIAVWEVFGKKVEEKERHDHGRWLELIADIGSMLCRKL